MSKFVLETFLKCYTYDKEIIENISDHNWFDEDESKDELFTVYCLNCKLNFITIIYEINFRKLTCEEVIIKKLLE
jgi:hypothetical protein